MMVQFAFLLGYLVFISLKVDAYPVESKPLNNNPDTWNFGEGWLLFNPRNSADPSASALIGSDPHVKKSKITPKSIFIAPNAHTTHEQMCPHGFRVDDNGKCIKTVTINQDEILAARISELFGIDEGPNKNSDIDSDYYDFDDESKSEKDTGPLQINLPLAIEIDEKVDGKRVEYVIEQKFSMRNLDPKDLKATTEKLDETTILTPVAETTESVFTEQSTTSSSTIALSAEETRTVTETVLPPNASQFYEDTSTMEMTTVEAATAPSTVVFSLITQETSRISPTITIASKTVKPVKIFSVDFLPKSSKKSNRFEQANARLKNVGDRERPRKQKTTAISMKVYAKPSTKLYKLETSKKNRTRDGLRPVGHRKSTTTSATTINEITTEITMTNPASAQKPFWWLPKGWSIDESKEKPVLVRFWSQQPFSHDERARSHNSRQQRVNSRMPSENIFQENLAPELDLFSKVRV